MRGRAPHRVSTVRRVAGVAAGSAVLFLAGACGGMPPQVAESGTDGLTIPTPSPDPGDFVAGLDQSWFAPEGRRSWRFTAGSASAGTEVTVRVEIESVSRTIAGVDTTPVVTSQTSQPSGAVRERRTRQTDWYAQDRAGNIWWFGHEGQPGTGGADWEAGRDGYLAGVALPAVPRTGDGFVVAQRVEEPVLVAEVLDADVEVEVPAGDYDAAAIRLRDPATGLTETRYYADGIGLVFRTTATGEWGLAH